MKIYITIIKDRHSDTTATPFIKKQDAIDFARESAIEYCRHKDDFKETDIRGWLYYAEYSCEGDCVWVTEHDLSEDNSVGKSDNLKTRLIKEYEEDKCLRRNKPDVPMAEELNRVLNAIGAEQIAIDTNPAKQTQGSFLFDLVFYMILHLSEKIDELKEGIR